MALADASASGTEQNVAKFLATPPRWRKTCRWALSAPDIVKLHVRGNVVFTNRAQPPHATLPTDARRRAGLPAEAPRL